MRRRLRIKARTGNSMWRSWRPAAASSTVPSKATRFMSSRCRERALVKVLAIAVMLGACALAAQSRAQAPADGAPRVRPDPYAGHKKVLIVGDLHTGNQIAHDAV